MNDVGFGELVIRMVISLAVVLGVMFGLYAILRRRQGYSPSSVSRSSRTNGSSKSIAKSSSKGSSKTSGNRTGLRVLGRLGVGRTSQLVAVQFADRVFLVGASEQSAPTVMAELDLFSWEAHIATVEESAVIREAIIPGHSSKTILDSLREVTARRV
ncbi:MAG: flagellar biosynthetic protein FliO [Ilumatobacteraceae bacterium]|jgi:hypothetical protein